MVFLRPVLSALLVSFLSVVTANDTTRNLQTLGVTSIQLINADTDDVIVSNIVSGSKIMLSQYGLSPTTPLNINAITSTSTFSVVFGVNSVSKYRTESSKPFSLCGDNAGSYLKCPSTLLTGAVTLSVTPYSALSGTGTMGTTTKIMFEIVTSGTAPVPAPVMVPTPVALPTKPIVAPTMKPVLAPVSVPTLAPITRMKPIYINTGAKLDMMGVNNIIWFADKYFVGGAIITRLSKVITNTKNQFLYQSERWGETPFSYSIPLEAQPGKYRVVFHFAEVYHTAVGERIFNFILENKFPVYDFDITKRAGSIKKAVTLSYNVYIEDLTLDIAFQTGLAGLPKIDAIEIHPIPFTSTLSTFAKIRN